MLRNFILGPLTLVLALGCSSPKSSKVASPATDDRTPSDKTTNEQTTNGKTPTEETPQPNTGEGNSQGGSWYKPSLTVSWNIQLSGTLNTSYNVELYDIDLFDTSKEKIAALKAEGRKVICYFSAGTSEDWRPDYSTIDASIKGENLDEWPGEKWLDISSPLAKKLYLSRLALAKEKGCDGVDPDNVDGYTQDSGFNITKAQQLAFNKMMAEEAHKLGLSAGLKNDLDQAAELAEYFDFSVNEQCQEYKECESLDPFIKLGKPVLNIEYKKAKATENCAYAKEAKIQTLVMPLELDGSDRIACFE